MRIAEDIVKNGITTGEAFNQALTNIIAHQGITQVIETGTYLGTGTTQAILKGLKQHGKKFTFFSLEVNPTHYRQAVMNIGVVDGLYLLNKLSVPKEQLPKEVTFIDYPDHVIVDHQEKVREKLYLAEVNYNVPDKGLQECLSAFGELDTALIVLDSAGIVGMQEFDEVLNHAKGTFFLALDDTNHVKHYKTVERIRQDSRFEVVWETNEKFGSLICAVQLP